MLVKNEKTGNIEPMRYEPATAAVAAGTHSFVNVDEEGEPKAEKKKAKKPSDSTGA